MKEDWFVYLVRCSDKSLYCGISTNVQRRVKEHNFSKKGAKYTRSRRPVSLVGFLRVNNRSEAQKLEFKIKKMKRENKLKFFELDN